MPYDTILFDINETILDLTSLRPKFKAAFDDESATAIWFSTLLHSSTVCALTGVKTDFASLAGVMLDAFASRQGTVLPPSVRDGLLSGFSQLPAHADVKPALSRLRASGYRTIAFSNSSVDLIRKQILNSGLSDYFDDIVSVEKSGSFKPDTNAYQFAAQHLDRPIKELRLVATHDWDTHGALTAGMMAAYIDRSGADYHPLYKRPDVFAATMNGVVDQILAHDGKS